ncbi:hypothetical protein AB4068_07570 [Arthrobacter sp. 2RAF22]|uniref:hypothetical protein n=1 Tax=Arthrobacter sp. 2RAF22 TaxID=3232996 RepID=UPI003F92DE3E
MMLSSIFVGLVGAFGLGLLARQAVAADLGQAHGWSRRGRQLMLYSVVAAVVIGVGLGQILNLDLPERMATAVFLALAGMSASKSIDANILIVAGLTKNFGIANLAASGAVCFGIVIAYFSGTLQLWLVLAFNAGSLLVQMTLIVLPRRRLLKGIDEGVFKPERLRSLLHRAWRAWRSQVVEASLLRVDSMMFITQATVQTVGYYSVVALIPQTAYQTFQTIIQYSYATAPKTGIRQRTWLTWQICMLASVPIVTAGALGAVVLVPLLFGPAFGPSLDLLLPACSVTIGLAALAPVLQHFAVSPTGDSWFPCTMIVLIATCWWLGKQTNPSLAVTVMGGVFVLVGGLYVYWLVGPRILRFSIGSWAILFGR